MTIPSGNSQRSRLNLQVQSHPSLGSFFVHWKSIFFLPMFEQFEVNSICKSASTPRFNLCSSITSKLTAPFLLARLVLDPRAEVTGKKFLGVWAFWVWHHLTKKVPHFQWQQEHLLLRDHSCDFLSKISLIVCVFCLFVCFFFFHFSEILVPSFLIKLTFSCFYHYHFFLFWLCLLDTFADVWSFSMWKSRGKKQHPSGVPIPRSVALFCFVLFFFF